VALTVGRGVDEIVGEGLAEGEAVFELEPSGAISTTFASERYWNRDSLITFWLLLEYCVALTSLTAVELFKVSFAMTPERILPEAKRRFPRLSHKV
jgi:hypothetical protein